MWKPCLFLKQKIKGKSCFLLGSRGLDRSLWLCDDCAHIIPCHWSPSLNQSDCESIYTSLWSLYRKPTYKIKLKIFHRKPQEWFSEYSTLHLETVWNAYNPSLGLLARESKHCIFKSCPLLPSPCSLSSFLISRMKGCRVLCHKLSLYYWSSQPLNYKFTWNPVETCVFIFFRNWKHRTTALRPISFLGRQLWKHLVQWHSMRGLLLAWTMLDKGWTQFSLVIRSIDAGARGRCFE